MSLLQTMRLITLLSLLLLSVLCSCRSAKQTVISSSDTTSVRVTELKETNMADEVRSLFASSRVMDLSGIKIEFFAPDSANNIPRASPKALSIESAKSKDTAEQITSSTSVATQKDSTRVDVNSAKVSNNTSCADSNVMKPPDFSFIFWSLVVIALLLIAKVITSKLRK